MSRLLFTLLLLSTATAWADPSEATKSRDDGPAWVDAHNKNGIRVWYRDREELGGREVRSEMHIDAAPEQVFKVLSDVEKYTEFMPYLEKMEVIETLADGRIQYEVVNAPVVSRRDYVLRITVTRPTPKSWAIAWKPAPEGKGPAESSKMVRIKLNEGQYIIEPDGLGTKLSYKLLTHPGGSIPAWIAKRSNTSAVPDLMDGIRKRSMDPTWKR